MRCYSGPSMGSHFFEFEFMRYFPRTLRNSPGVAYVASIQLELEWPPPNATTLLIDLQIEFLYWAGATIQVAPMLVLIFRSKMMSFGKGGWSSRQRTPNVHSLDQIASKTPPKAPEHGQPKSLSLICHRAIFRRPLKEKEIVALLSRFELSISRFFYWRANSWGTQVTSCCLELYLLILPSSHNLAC